MNDMDLRKIRVYARPDDPSSPFIWGKSALSLTKGGPFTVRGHQVLKGKDGKPRKPRQVSFYEGEILTEPDPNVSNQSIVGEIVHSMIKAGWTFDECEAAMLDPRNPGGQFWHWSSFTDANWLTYSRKIWHESTHTDKASGIKYTMVPVSAPVKGLLPTDNKAFHFHPEVSFLNPITGELCIAFDALHRRLYTVGTTPKEFSINDDLLARVVECITNTHGMGVRECITEARTVIKSERVAKSYVYEAIARGYALKEDNGRGRKSPVSVTSEGRAFLQTYLDARAEVALTKRLAAMPTPVPVQGDNMTPAYVLGMLTS